MISNGMEPTPEEKTTEESGRFSRFMLSLGIEERGAKVLIAIVIIVVFFSVYISFRLMAPFGFPENKMITIELIKPNHIVVRKIGGSTITANNFHLSNEKEAIKKFNKIVKENIKLGSIIYQSQTVLQIH